MRHFNINKNSLLKILKKTLCFDGLNVKFFIKDNFLYFVDSVPDGVKRYIYGKIPVQTNITETAFLISEIGTLVNYIKILNFAEDVAVLEFQLTDNNLLCLKSQMGMFELALKHPLSTETDCSLERVLDFYKQSPAMSVVLTRKEFADFKQKINLSGNDYVMFQSSGQCNILKLKNKMHFTNNIVTNFEHTPNDGLFSCPHLISADSFSRIDIDKSESVVYSIFEPKSGCYYFGANTDETFYLFHFHKE